MIESLQDLLGWLPWIGGGSLVTVIVVALLAPSVLTVASSWLSALSPLIKGLAEALVEFAKALYAGLLDMFDNAKSIIFVITLVAGAFLWGYSYGYSPKGKCPVCPTCTTTDTKVTPKKQPKYEWVDPLEWFGL